MLGLIGNKIKKEFWLFILVFIVVGDEKSIINEFQTNSIEATISLLKLYFFSIILNMVLALIPIILYRAITIYKIENETNDEVLFFHKATPNNWFATFIVRALFPIAVIISVYNYTEIQNNLLNIVSHLGALLILLSIILETILKFYKPYSTPDLIRLNIIKSDKGERIIARFKDKDYRINQTNKYKCLDRLEKFGWKLIDTIEGENMVTKILKK